MNKPCKPITLFLVGAIILLAAGQGAARGFVLCIGNGDHYALEPAFSGKCKTDKDPCHREKELCAGDHCGPCQDIEASVTSMAGRSRDDQALTCVAWQPALAVWPSFIASSYVRYLTGNLFSQPPPGPLPPFLSLQTIVLLI